MSAAHVTTQTVKLNDVAPPAFTAPGKSLIGEIQTLREAVLLLCELQRELTVRVEEALTTITKEAAS